MSRIVGLVSEAAPGERVRRADAMISTLQVGSVRKTVELGDAALAWAGWRAPAMASANDVAVVLDGAIFNRDELDDGMLRGRTSGATGTMSDAALLIRLYHRLGMPATLERLRGDFAIALHDRKRAATWLARDRIGVKPLYYLDRPRLFAFASQPRALLALPGVEARPDPRFVALFAASHYRVFDNAPARSPYAGIAQLPAAHAVERRDGRVRQIRYWQLRDEPEVSGSEEELAERYREMLLEAVGCRLAAADRPAFTLSGGLDSSSVLSSAVELSGHRQHAYSSTYTDPTYDETTEIRPMLESKVEAWHPIAIGDPQVFDLVEEMVRIHDEPVATATWLSHHLLCRQVAADGFGALFGGLGGDELNAGEYEYFPFFFADLRAAGAEAELELEIARWAKHHDHPVFRKSRAVAEEKMAAFTDPSVPGRCLPDRERLLRYRGALNPDFFSLGDFIPEMDHPFQSCLKNRTYQDLFRETAPCCLRAEDRQTTASRLDHFDPFLDHRLIELMFRVPGHLKIRDGVTKRLLRSATRGLLPEATRTRIAKTGWNAPAHVWFTGAGAERLRDLVSSRTFRERGIYNAGVVEKVIDEHETIVASGEARENHMMFLWQLVNLELWLQSLDQTSARC